MTSRLVTTPLAIMIFASVISGVVTITSIAYQLPIGSTFSVNILGQNISFTLDNQGLLILMFAVASIGVISGISIFGSGLSTMSQAIIYKSIFFYLTWGILSVLSANIILTIPVFGSIVWIGLTIFYVVGVQEQIGTHPT